MALITDKQGMKEGDLIHSFAGITAGRDGLQAIGALVSRSEGVSEVTKMLQ